VDYAVNYDYISKVLCVNKSRPEVRCNGKCQLVKELAKASETEKPASQNDKKAFSPIELFCDTAHGIVLPGVVPVFTTSAVFYYPISKSVGFDGSVFHPPVLA